MDYLRTFHDIMAATKQWPPPWEVWAPQIRALIAEGKAELWPIGLGDKMVGGVLFGGNTIHIAVLPEAHGLWVNRRLRRAYDTWTHDVPIVATIKPDNKAAIRLATGLGFVLKEEGPFPYHTFEKEPKPCPQSS